ncbi:hypothetical protein OF83DRAFT_1178113 [Amylostereum chailletii]|nr:hypothetical protein OF83DRAFT_1178113 [Amylostereum chailletii]
MLIVLIVSSELGLSFGRWISKIISTRVHFLRVASMIGSNRLSPFLDHVVPIVCVPGDICDCKVDITRDTLRTVAHAAGWRAQEGLEGDGQTGKPGAEAEEGSQVNDPGTAASSGLSEDEGPSQDVGAGFPPIGDTVIDGFFHELYLSLPPRPPKFSVGSLPGTSTASGTPAASLEYTTSLKRIARRYKAHVHCECALLASLHGRRFIPYIGVSKLSCKLCHMYFSAYSEVMGASIATQGYHSQLVVPWLSPDLRVRSPDLAERVLEENRDVHDKLKTKILQEILDHLRRLEKEENERRAKEWRNRTHARLASQSTTGSCEGLVSDMKTTSADEDAAVAEAKAAIKAETLEDHMAGTPKE